MRALINFLIKNSSWFLFLFLEAVCFYFIFNTDSYQKSVLLNSSNEISGKIYFVSGNVVSYFGLREVNQELMEENANLQYQLSVLRNNKEEQDNGLEKIESFISDSGRYMTNYDLVLARVINNSVSNSLNYITLNKGSKDGIAEDMGVISHQGIVGVVRAVNENYSVVQPVLNINSRFGCKVINTNTPAMLVWNERDPRFANLVDYPKYEKIQKGDTIVTSGFSEVFPEGVFVGIVESYKSQVDDNFYDISVKLSTDFAALKYVIVINSLDKAEKHELENKVSNVQK